MEEPVGAQLAVHIALHTLKDRCRNLQQRVTALEEENLNLRVQCNKNDEKSESLSEIDKLKGQITEMSEHKQQLLNKVRMVTNENQELWNKLSRLTHVNQNLGTQLSKINDSLVQYTTKSKEAHSPLIRSKTFTQDEPHTKVLQKNLEENGKICSELEEISLKIISSFAQGKNELDSLYSEIVGLQCSDNIITDSCGFYYDDYDNNILDNFNSILEELKTTKEVMVNQKVALQLALNKLNQLQEIKKKSICDSKLSKKNEMVDKSTSTLSENEVKESLDKSINQQILPEASMQNPPEGMDMICPVCCKNFCSGTDFKEFETHVEKHFADEETFELL
ncbi:forkhead-associated domain-containing protein 1 [Asbolus verrucosus]|uniref:Forkhead-associated domain-containing protein 1 n=1 Tax=Asbolus verrucosus TaxID=1661398 RepID=A0A482VPK2_ASBVE|nr:forkhead-associated domain-containing protein 1 [Asbolus verrucosus]